MTLQSPTATLIPLFSSSELTGCSELENSGIKMAVGDCSVTERRRWRPPYQTGKTVHVHAKHYKHNEDGRTAPGVCGILVIDDYILTY